MTRRAGGSGVVVVTGASTGIGEATALRLAAAGFAVLAGVRREEDAQRLAAALGAQGEPVRLDVTHAADVAALAARIEEMGAVGRRLAGVVNNAGVAVVGPVEVLSVEEWREQFEVNVLGAVAVTRALLPALLRSRGRVVNIGSISGRVAFPLMGPYAASKHALEAFSDTLRREVRGHGVDVVCIEPGAIATPIWGKSDAASAGTVAAMSEEQQARYAAAIRAMRRWARESTHTGLDPAAVAAVVERALAAARPRPHYVVGRDARLQAVVTRLVPAGVFDAVVARALR